MPLRLDPRAHPCRAPHTLALAAGILATFVVARWAHAQVVAVDEGTFAVTRAGRSVGREEFRIVRQPAGGGAGYVARGVAAYGARRVTPALQAGTDGEPLRYQVEVHGGGPDERVSAQAGNGNHFAAQMQRGTSEGAREYLLAPGTVVADDEAYHQLYFVVQRARAGATTVPVLVPRTDAQLLVVVTRVGSEPVTIDGRPIAATHYALADARTGWKRDVWADADGRVLRVAVPALALDAVREDPPH